MMTNPGTLVPRRYPFRPKYSVFGEVVLDCYSLFAAALETFPPQSLALVLNSPHSKLLGKRPSQRSRPTHGLMMQWYLGIHYREPKSRIQYPGVGLCPSVVRRVNRREEPAYVKVDDRHRIRFNKAIQALSFRLRSTFKYLGFT